MAKPAKPAVPSRTYEFPKQFLETVRTMPWAEALELLEDRRQEVLARLYGLSPHDESVVDLGYILSAIKGEMKLVLKKMDQHSLRTAIREALGEEAYAHVIKYLKLVEAHDQHVKGLQNDT